MKNSVKIFLGGGLNTVAVMGVQILVGGVKNRIFKVC
jgi:hypothetical protein